jgi:putative transposase
MRKRRFMKDQIITILKEHQAGLSVDDLCRKHGISDVTFYKWKSKLSGIEMMDAKRMRELEAENTRLKKLLAETMMDVATLREMLENTACGNFEEESPELRLVGSG